MHSPVPPGNTKFVPESFAAPLVRSLTVEYVGEEEADIVKILPTIQKVIGDTDVIWQNTVDSENGIRNQMKAIKVIPDKAPDWVESNFFFFDDFLTVDVLQRVPGRDSPPDADWQNTVDSDDVIQIEIDDNQAEPWDEFWSEPFKEGFVRLPAPDAPVHDGAVQSRGVLDEFTALMTDVFGDFGFELGLQAPYDFDSDAPSNLDLHSPPVRLKSGVRVEYMENHFVEFFFDNDNRPFFRIRQSDEDRLIDVFAEMQADPIPFIGPGDNVFVGIARRDWVLNLRFSMRPLDGDKPQWDMDRPFTLNICFPTGKADLLAFQETLNS